MLSTVLDAWQCLCQCTRKGDWDGWGMVSLVPASPLFAAQHARVTGRLLPGHSDSRTIFPPALVPPEPPPPPRYSGTEVAGEPRYLHHLFPLPSPPPEEGKSSATALNKHLLLSPLFSQEQLCHQLPTAHIHEQPEAFPFHQGIASSQCRWEQGQAWRAAAK